MDIVKFTSTIENIVEKYDLSSIVSSLKDEYSISKSSKLSEEIVAMQEDGRTLKLGIIGRVKSGKSSLINALIFDGKDILPKAATPMTAALTILKYGENLEAEVDFFSKDDIDDIKTNYDRYNKIYKEMVEAEFEKLLKIKSRLNKVLDKDKDEIRKRAENIAAREIKNNQALSAAYDQFERVSRSGVKLSDIEKNRNITASSMEELNKKLYDFVGANGKYMPFTKSVTLKINEDSLKDIEIIDTPGVNDPVVSREERTKQLLKTCDVVLIVSPSGQFLSAEDTNLLDRITQKEGIREIYIVASQVDNQLFGSEKTKGDGRLPAVLSNISSTLSSQQRSVLNSFKNSHQEVGSALDALMNNSVMLSSAVAFSMLKNYDDKSSWDENTKHVWGNLTTHYQEFFDNEETALLNLSRLAGIDNISGIIANIKSKKDEILEQRKSEFISVRKDNLLKYQKAIKDQINATIQKIKLTDINDIKAQSEEMQRIKSKAIEAVDDKYADKLVDFELNIKEVLFGKVDRYFKKLADDVEQSEGSETESYQVSTSKWWNPFSWGSSETRYNTYTTVKAGFVRNSIDEVITAVESLTEIEYKQNIANLKKELLNILVSTARDVAGDDALDPAIISRTIRSVIASVEYPNISYSDDFPKELKKSGTLKGYDAEQFLEAASEYARSLKGRVKQDIKSSVDILIKSFKNQNIAENIFAKYDDEIKALLSDIENKEQALDRYEIIIKELDSATAK